MNEERLKILEMLAQDKITVEDASRLLDAIGDIPSADSISAPATRNKPRFLRVMVNDKDEEVNIRVPLQLIRAGVNLGAMMPDLAKTQVGSALNEKGINLDFSNLKGESIDELVEALSDLAVDVNEKDGAVVRIFCE